MTNWDNDPFFQYPRNMVATSEGDVEMPILYYDSSQVMAFFWVDIDKAQAQLSDGLEVVRFGKKALAVLAFYEYRKTSIGVYNEVGTAIACVPKGKKYSNWPLCSLFQSLDKGMIGFNVIDLPVTTAAACAAGRDIWNYPKFVTPIQFSWQAGQFMGAVYNPAGGGPICTLQGRPGLGISASLINLILYSVRQSKVLRTLINIRAKGRVCLAGSMRLHINASQHPMAKRMIAMGWQDAKPAFIAHTHGLQLRLNSGAVLP